MIISKTQEQLIAEITGFCNTTSQADVARSIGVSRAYMSDILKGKRSISKKVAKFFGYAVEVLPATRIFKKIENNNDC